MKNLTDYGVVPFKHNALIFIAVLTGQVIAAEYFLPMESGTSVITSLAAVIGFNIGNVMITKISERPEYDEREYQNMDRGLIWGFIVAASMLGVDLTTSLSWSKADILIISTSAAILVMICKNYRQTEGLWKKIVKNWKQKISGGRKR